MSALVETKYGKLQGYEKEGLQIFKGIPFARPPVGKLRFQAPQPPEPWDGVREATKWGGACPQDKIPIMNVGEMSEDCLYLNVWTPACDGKKRPVMFWIHGGGFMIGSTAQGEYNGKHLAKNGDVVVVSTNYRLGAFGFLHLSELLGEGFPSASNNGIRDQIAALEWVRENIEAFGGNPADVTIFGESAGGMSVSTLLGSPKSKGLFAKAIPQSGAANHSISSEDGTRAAKAVLDALGIDPKNPEKLWEVDAKSIVKAQRASAKLTVAVGPGKIPQTAMTLIPVVDGDVLTKGTWEAINDGIAKDVSVMTGTTLEEWRLFSQMAELTAGMSGGEKPPQIDADKLGQFVEAGLPGRADAAIALYSKGREGAKPQEIYTAIETDRMFRAPATRLVEAQSKHNKNTYLYRVDFAGPTFGACHAIDIPLVFGGVDNPFGQMFTGGGEKARTVSKNMQDAWLSFAKTGKPGHAGLPEWPAYEESRRATMLFNAECKVVEDPDADHRKFWDDILPR